MKKQIPQLVAIALTTAILIMPTFSVFAQNRAEMPPPATPAPQATFTLQNPLRSEINSVGALVENFVEIFSYIVILLAVVALIFVGFKYILYSAQGKSADIAKLHGWLFWIVIGVAVVIGARVIVKVVINTISATGTVSPGVIQSANDAINRN